MKRLFLLGFQGMLVSGGNTIVDVAAKHTLEKPINKRLGVLYSDFKGLANMFSKKLWQTEGERSQQNKI